MKTRTEIVVQFVGGSLDGEQCSSAASGIEMLRAFSFYTMTHQGKLGKGAIFDARGMAGSPCARAMEFFLMLDTRDPGSEAYAVIGNQLENAIKKVITAEYCPR